MMDAIFMGVCGILDPTSGRKLFICKLKDATFLAAYGSLGCQRGKDDHDETGEIRKPAPNF